MVKELDLHFSGISNRLDSLQNTKKQSMDEITFQVEQDPYDGGYVAEAVISKNEQIITQADTVEELREMIKDALACHFDETDKMPQKVILKFVREEVLAID